MDTPRILFIAGLVAVAASASAQHHSNRANWDLQEKYSNAALSKFVYSSSVAPRWINESNRFWYVWNDSNGKRFMFVNPKSKTKKPAFDHEKLAFALSELGKKPVVGSQLPFNSISYNEEETVISFRANKVDYEWHIADETLAVKEKDDDEEKEEEPTRPPSRFGGSSRGGSTHSLAPDELTFVYMKGYNLYFGKKEDKVDKVNDIEVKQLTEDGEQFYEFRGVNYRTYKRDDKQDKPARVNAVWSEDSKAFAVTRHDARKVEDLFVINVLSNPRPKLETYKYQMPGEENVEQVSLYVFDTEAEKLVKVPAEKFKDQAIFNVHWTGEDHDVLRFVRRDRPQRNLELCEYDLESGEIKVLITEAVEDAHIEMRFATYVGENNTGDIVWWSERSGWGHIYHYSHEGELKNSITSGSWRVDRVLGTDEEKGRVWFSGLGKESGENIYNRHHYSVKLDGSDLRLLDTGDASHSMSLSESRDFGVDNSSRPDLVPSSVLRDDKGRTVIELETMDLSKLEEMGWRMPERYTVKAADGVTDIYGNMWKPYDFNPNKVYPIVLYVYPGPQTEAVTNTFRATGRTQELAQLGFIVVEIGNRGGTPQRSNAYHSHGYYNLRDYGLADKKAGVEQLAGRHDFIDINRVGIFGHSGGGFMTAAAMLMPPYNEFFKVGVSSAGNHDNNIYNSNWSEQHHGLKVKEEKSKNDDGEEETTVEFDIKVPTTVELAGNLKGKLLLVHGDIDNNVHPGNTVRLVDALIKANKRFDFMIMPGQRHGFGSMNGYFQQMMYEYFARHLLGDTYDRSAEIKEKGN